MILCLPDDAAREAVALIDNPAVKVIDASTAHRVAPGWAYGFPEMAPGQRRADRRAPRGSPTPAATPPASSRWCGPWCGAGLIPADWPMTVNAVSGYSGGGKAMIAEFEDAAAPGYTDGRLPHLRPDT